MTKTQEQKLLESSKQMNWGAARENLKDVVIKFPNMLVNVIDAAYLAGLDADRQTVVEWAEQNWSEMVKDKKVILLDDLLTQLKTELK